MFDQSVLNNPEYVQDGRVTDKGMAELRARMPHADLDGFDAVRDINQLSEVFTGSMLCKFIQGKLEAAGGAG